MRCEREAGGFSLWSARGGSGRGMGLPPRARCRRRHICPLRRCGAAGGLGGPARSSAALPAWRGDGGGGLLRLEVGLEVAAADGPGAADLDARDDAGVEELSHLPLGAAE